MFRGRRLRKNTAIRSMMKETHIEKSDLIYPLFIVEGTHIKKEIATLPDVYQYSLDYLPEILDEMVKAGVLSCMLFGVPEHKDACGSGAYDNVGIIQQAIQMIKSHCPQMYVIGDVCMCEYTDHGHCGILHGNEVDNDATLVYLNKIALSYAKAGIDMVAPSAMMDGQIASIRKALDEEGYQDLPIMAYSAKYASSFYGPFRIAANSAPSFGNRKGYQMDYANSNEAMREIEADIQEGADMIMVKPALAYLDIIQKAKTNFAHPLVAYNVSGEYAMLKLAVKEGIVREEAIYESVLAIKRAGADVIITYFALYIANLMDTGDTL